MKIIEAITAKSFSLDKSLSASKIVGLKVLSTSGFRVGYVKEVQLDLNANKEGLSVRRNIWKSSLFIGREYIERISQSGVFLSIFPSILWKGKNILTASGKVIGKVKDVQRKHISNNIESITLNAIFKKDVVIPVSAIKTWGNSVVLKNSYNVKQKYFWQKS